MIREALARIASPLLSRTVAPKEGEPRPGPWPVINPDGWLPDMPFLNFWQMGIDPTRPRGSAVVEACVAAYSQTIAQCPGDHWRALANGGRERVTTSALSRLLRWPNDYQSRSDFVLNLVRQLYLTGNSYHLAQRNDRYEVDELHPFDPRTSGPVIADDSSIFYKLDGNNVLQPRGRMFQRRDPFLVPARDCLHIKLEAEPDQPLVGIPPLRHAEHAVAAQGAIGSSLLRFFSNMSRPSGVLSTDLTLTETQLKELRQKWDEQAKGLNAGGVPILTAGLKFNPMAVSAKDAELINTLKLSQDEIFMVYGVPPAILGLADKSQFSSTEALMQFWLSRGLGFAINHVEVAFDQFFNLKGWPDEWVEFDTAALLRVAYKDRIEALVRGVQGAVYSPNEARRSENLPDAKYGDEPRVQQQVVPLSAWAQTEPQTPGQPPAPPAPPTSGGGSSDSGGGSGSGNDPGNPGDDAASKALILVDETSDEELQTLWEEETERHAHRAAA